MAVCGRQFSMDTDKVCKRVPDHGGLHRETVTFKAHGFQWGDNECVDSPGRAPVAPVEPTPRPAMKRISLTPKMADALGTTIEINGKQAMIMSHPKTQAALAERGLATEHGYLTDQGRFIAHLISLGTVKRSWSWDTIEAGTRTWLSDQKRHTDTSEPERCGAVDAGDLDACGNCADCKPKPASEFQVKIWYASGAYEEIDHAPAHVATTVYAEAEDSDRVVAAEIHGCATHKLHRSFRRELDSAPVVG